VIDSALVAQGTCIGHNINAAENANVTIGDLNITSLSSNDLVTYTKQLLKFFTHRDWVTAEAYLNSLKSLTSLDDECKSLLMLLQYKFSLLTGSNKEINPDVFLELLRSPRSGAVIKDVVESIYIHYLSIESKSNAKERFSKSLYKDAFTHEVFYEVLANSEDLGTKIKSGTSDFFECELCSFVRCSIRCKNFELAIELSKVMFDKYKNINSEILLSLSLAYRLHECIEGKHYWLINFELMSELEERINNCINLSKDNSDTRIVQIAAVLLASTCFQSVACSDICIENLEEAEKVIPKIRDFLCIGEEKIDNAGSAKKILNKEELNISEQEFTQVSSAFIEGSLTERHIRKWLDSGGTVASTSDPAKEFIHIVLSSMICGIDDRQQKFNLSKRLEAFIESNQDGLNEFNVHALQQLSVNLGHIGLPLHVVKLVEPILPLAPWASPIIDIYAESLLACDQLKKLDELLLSMNNGEDSFRLLAVKVERAHISNDYKRAIALSELAISKYEHSCFYWAQLLRASYSENIEPYKIQLIVSRIPKESIKSFSFDGLNLLHLVAKSDLSLAESVAMEWFIDDPVGMATNVTNLHFSNLKRNNDLTKNVYPSERCSTAFVYTKRGRTYTKLLVDDCNSSEYLLNPDSPLGELLSDMDVGEEAKEGMSTIKLIEKLPAIVGAFRISINIRDDINPGDDCFYSLSINEEDGVEGMLKQIDSISQQKQTIEHEIDGKAIPILMRLKHSHETDIVKGAFIYLCDEASNKTLNLSSEGKVVDEAVIVDVLSIAYFCLTGLSKGLIQLGVKVYVTQETHDLVISWLDDMSRTDFLSIAKVGDNFIKTTANDIAKDNNISNLKELIESCEILIPSSLNMPEILTNMKDVVDISHYSSLKTSISHSIPFFCVDHAFCQLYRQQNVILADVYKLTVDAKLASNSIEASLAECHIQFNLPVPLSHQDIIELCSQESKGQYLASEVIKKYPNNYSSSESALHVLTNSCLKSISSAYLGVKSRFDLSEWKYTEHIVYACSRSSMVCLKGETCEKRLALLIFHVLETFKTMEDVTKFTLTFFRRFVHGHFLDVKQIDLELNTLRDSRKAKKD
jgi:hypothetical protein